jgi:hypothetical protein
VRDIEVMGRGSPGYAKDGEDAVHDEVTPCGAGGSRSKEWGGRTSATASITCLGWGGRYTGCSGSGGTGEADVVLQGARGGGRVKVNQRGAKSFLYS